LGEEVPGLGEGAPDLGVEAPGLGPEVPGLGVEALKRLEHWLVEAVLEVLM
jgi:hypothetical protein